MGLRAITPLSVLYCVALPFLPQRSRLPLYIGIWPTAEAAFYLLFYLPRKWILQHPAVHPYLYPAAERNALFQRCVEHIPDPERYLSKWFKDAPLLEVKRENVKEFYRWAFLNTSAVDPADEIELEENVEKFEEYTGHKLEPGYGKAKSLRLTLDKVDMIHRSLAWYLIVFVVDNMTHFSMLCHGFKYHRTSIIRFPLILPPRPLTLCAVNRSPVKALSYWLRPHTSTTKLPIVFLHGIGIGLWPYVNFLAALNKQGSDGGEIGIIAIEILPISFRITQQALGREEMCRQIENILFHHGFESFVLVAHSYGSFIATHLLKDPAVSEKISSLVLVDPPTILLHLPDVCYNFTYRQPRGANEWQLWYFACKDPQVAHTLSRRFFWSESILWKEDISDKRTSIFLGGRDQVIDAKQVGMYLTNLHDFVDEGLDVEGSWKESGGVWTAPNGQLKVVWGQELDHAQIFDSDRRLPGLVAEVLMHSASGS